MKKSNQKSVKYVIALLLVILLALAVGYAAFNDTLKITGTANANGTFDMQFASATVKNAVGVDATGTTATISEDKETLTVAVKDLAYPGAGAQFDVTIKNNGTIPAKVNNVTPVGIEGSTNIKIKGLEQITSEHPTIAAGATCTFSFTVEWDKTSDKELTEEEKTGISFNLDVEYIQDTTDVFSGSSSHTDA